MKMYRPAHYQFMVLAITDAQSLPLNIDVLEFTRTIKILIFGLSIYLLPLLRVCEQ